MDAPTRRAIIKGAGLGLAARPGLPASPEWKPFRPIENSTLHVVSDPGAYATRNNQFTWELEWRPERRIYPGAEIELRSLSLRTYYEWKYTAIEIEPGDVTFRRHAVLTSSELFALRGRWIIARCRLQYPLAEGEPLRIRLRALPPWVAGLFEAVSLWVAEAKTGSQPKPEEAEFVPDPLAQAILRVGPGPVECLGVYCHPMPDPHGKVRAVLAPEDRFGNLSEFRQAVPVTLEWEGKTWTEQVKQSRILRLPAPANIGRLRAAVPSAALAPTENIANAERSAGRLLITGNPVWAKAPGGRRAAFGEFHWHTEMSADGGRALPDALVSARDHLNLNYASPSDHRPRPEQWQYTVSVLDEFERPGEFATFYGYEYSTARGHENYYFVNPRHPIAPGGAAKLAGDVSSLAPELSKHHAGDRFLAIPHHTNAESETRRLADDVPYWFPYRWTRPAPYHRNVELFQTRGNQERDEYPDDGWRGWHSNGAPAQRALALGYKLGFTGGTDNHTCRPGRALAGEEAIGRIPLNSTSLTGLWTEQVDRGRVFDALYARRTWAVWDTRAIVYFTVAGAEAGEEIGLRRGAPLTARIKISAEDQLQSIEVVSEGRTVWQGSSREPDLDITVPLGQAAGATHFYLRARQRNGGLIYASPVFISVAA